MNIHCPYHEDSTASLKVYPDGYFCFGCGRKGPIKELEEALKCQFNVITEDKEPENIEEKIAYINTLPKITYRGLVLPADDRGAYIIWPGNTFYKYRIFNPGAGPKYIGPSGHTPPLFWAGRGTTGPLFIIEGEINSLSVAKAFPNNAVCSPGSASMFDAKNLIKYLSEFQDYATIVIVLDKDAAGDKGLIAAKSFMMYKVPFVHCLQLEKDSNEILCEYGPEVLKEAITRKMSSWL